MGSGNKLTDDDLVREHLAGLSHAELVNVALELSRSAKRWREAIVTSGRVRRGPTDEIVALARQELDKATALHGRPSAVDFWDQGWYDPREDYASVRTYFERLRAAGTIEELLALALLLLDESREQIEFCDHDGEFAFAVGECLEPVWRALEESDLDPAARILRVYDLMDSDEYSVCEGVTDSTIWDAPRDAWSRVADVLLEKPHAVSSAERRTWLRRTIDALAAAERSDEAAVLAVSTMNEQTGDRGMAVRVLLAAGRRAEAWRVACEGLAKSGGRYWSEWELRGALHRIALEDGDPRLAAALSAEVMALYPDAEHYGRLRADAEAAGAWDEVRTRVLAGLAESRDWRESEGWPLPPTGTPAPSRAGVADGPHYALLVEIAVEEGDPDVALRWYEKARAEPHRVIHDDAVELRLADLLSATYPDAAIDIWSRFATDAIAEVKRAGYEEARGYLRRIGDLLKSLGRDEEWTRRLSRLRAEHKRKRTLISLLAGLD